MLLATLVLLFTVVLLLAMVVVTHQSPRRAASEEHFASSHATTADAAEDAKHDTRDSNGGAKNDDKNDADATTVLPSWVQAEHQRDDRGRVEEDSSTIMMHDQDQRAMPELETFDHHEPDRSVMVREYGMDYVPPEVWSVPQHRPPQCYHSVSKPCHECPSALSTPFTSVQEAAEQTAVGSILPTFTYREDSQVA